MNGSRRVCVCVCALATDGAEVLLREAHAGLVVQARGLDRHVVAIRAVAARLRCPSWQRRTTSSSDAALASSLVTRASERT